MPADTKSPGEITRIHERLDQLMAKMTEVAEGQAEIAASCGPCRSKIASLDTAINGNGHDGLKQQVAALKESAPRADTLSVGAMLKILSAVGALAGAIAAAVGGLVANLSAKTP